MTERIMACFPLVAKTFAGLEDVLAAELVTLGASDVQPARRAVSFSGDQRLMYRANVCCRTAVRILKPIAGFAIDPGTADPHRALYAAIRELDWSLYLDPHGSLAIDPVVHGSTFTNSLYASQVTKDAIVDRFRGLGGVRPAVEREAPDLRINLHIAERVVTVYLDASGQSLHKRGYRRATNEAPLNEVLAAGILQLTGWDRQSPLVDFMCGSGTLPIEAALLARNIAPGTLRADFGYGKWKDFDSRLHAAVIDEACSTQLPRAGGPIVGSDLDSSVLVSAGQNAQRAGVAADIVFRQSNLETARPPAPGGWLVINPPYDERQKIESVAGFYRRLGDVLKQNWSGYTASIFSGNLEAAKQIGLRTSGRVRLFNGPIECRLLRFELYAGSGGRATEPLAPAEPVTETHLQPTVAPTAAYLRSVDLLRNRLERMGKHWSRWARRQGITCYRLYDRDIPEIPLSIDRYEQELMIVEHARPHDRSQIEQRLWLEELVETAATTLGIAADHVHVKSRRGGGRSRPRHDSHERDALIVAGESGLQVEVDLSGHDDIGLPLDQRLVRQMIAREAAGKRFLNLFGRAGAASVSAAAGGSSLTVTVEPAPALVERSRRNLARNGLAGPAHQVLEADPLEFLDESVRRHATPFEVVFVWPPAELHRRENDRSWDPRVAYLSLIERARQLVAPGGKLYFLTTARRFKLSADDVPDARLHELTRQTTPPDFQARPVHRCYLLRGIGGEG